MATPSNSTTRTWLQFSADVLRSTIHPSIRFSPRTRMQPCTSRTDRSVGHCSLQTHWHSVMLAGRHAGQPLSWSAPASVLMRCLSFTSWALPRRCSSSDFLQRPVTAHIAQVMPRASATRASWVVSHGAYPAASCGGAGPAPAWGMQRQFQTEIPPLLPGLYMYVSGLLRARIRGERRGEGEEGEAEICVMNHKPFARPPTKPPTHICWRISRAPHLRAPAGQEPARLPCSAARRVRRAAACLRPARLDPHPHPHPPCQCLAGPRVRLRQARRPPQARSARLPACCLQRPVRHPPAHSFGRLLQHGQPPPRH